ncbi:MAG: hypothetical protein IJT15_02230 [Rickettsiales bacterium]|nr:hypothetical protein [Rickettsiales bacterium]
MENKNNKTQDIIIFDLTGKTKSVLNKSESINIGDDVLIDVSDATNIYNKIRSKSDKFSLEAEIEKKVYTM